MNQISPFRVATVEMTIFFCEDQWETKGKACSR